MRTGEYKTCSLCGKSTYLYLSQLKRGRGKFCSVKCASKVNSDKRNKRIEKKCEICEKTFLVKISKSKKRFCSMKCFSKKINKTCVICNKQYQVQRYNTKSKCCSYKCLGELCSKRTPHWLGKKRPDLKLPHHWGKGELHPNWQGGKTQLSKNLRHLYVHQQWAKNIKERDNYTCQICGKRGGDMHADHIKSFSLYPELRLELNNGRTLCVPCHFKTETYGNKKQKIKYA